MAGPVIYGPDNRPLAPSRRFGALVGGSHAPYDAGAFAGQHMADWNPILWSADAAKTPWRDRIVARIRDLVANDGWASGAITRLCDNAIGAVFRPIAKPDYQALRFFSGAAFDAAWANEFGRWADAHWRSWADDPSRWCDAERRLTFAQVSFVAFRHLVVDGDALAVLRWLPERVSPGRARYATVVQLIDPDRLSNPRLQWDNRQLRGGVEIDDNGAAIAFHIRRAHQLDWWAAADSVSWERIPRETDWGRPVVVHHFEHQRAGEHRGATGVLTPVVQRLKALVRYDGAELDAAIINAIFSAYIESPFDRQLVEDALGGDDGHERLNAYQTGRADWHGENRTRLAGAVVPIMFPGEKINTVSAARPTSNFADFESAVLRNVASGTGLSAQQVSNDWSDVNYSSARAAMIEFWKTLHRRRHDHGIGFAAPVRMAWLEEAMEVDCPPLPAGAPDYLDCRAAYARCLWMGPGRGWVDPVAEKQGATIGLDAALSTLEHELADNAGLDWEEVLEQRAIELRTMKDLGVPPPTWIGLDASKAAKKPDAE